MTAATLSDSAAAAAHPTLTPSPGDPDSIYYNIYRGFSARTPYARDLYNNYSRPALPTLSVSTENMTLDRSESARTGPANPPATSNAKISLDSPNNDVPEYSLF